MEAKCPHCGKTIDIIGASELHSEYGINANRLQGLRDKGKFPEAWIHLVPRYLYLRSDVEKWKTERAQEVSSKTVNSLRAVLDALPPDEAKKALEELTRASGGK